MTEQTSIFYTCKACTPVPKELRVTARARNDQDILRWMDGVIRIINFDHTFNNPRCTDKNCDLMMPITKDTTNAWIGMPCEQGRFKTAPEVTDR